MKNMVIALIGIIISGLGTFKLYGDTNYIISNYRSQLDTGGYSTIGNDFVTQKFFKNSILILIVSCIAFIIMCLLKNKLSKKTSIILAAIQVLGILAILFYEVVVYNASQVI